MCDIEGQRVTTLARTVLDLLRTLTMERSVAIGDTALRLGLTLEDLAEVAGRCIGWRGMLQARRAIKFWIHEAKARASRICCLGAPLIGGAVGEKMGRGQKVERQPTMSY